MADPAAQRRTLAGGSTVDEVVQRWQQAGRKLPVESASTCVWEAGEGEPVVCLHGVPTCAFLYRKLVPELAARGLRGLAFDFAGLGLADRPAAPSFDYTWTGLAAWTVKALDALGLDRFHLVVHDIGGPIGFEVVRRLPERIRSLTVLNTLIRVDGFRRPWSMEPFARRVIGDLYLAMLLPAAFEMLLRREAIATAVPSAEIRAYARLLKHGDGGASFLKVMRGFELTADFEARLHAALRARAFPAQVIWGVADRALPIETQGESARRALGLEALQRVPGKHLVPEDCPELIAEAVARLVGR
jgi:pimeloyl-ACP methyl ester carboxylesterase